MLKSLSNAWAGLRVRQYLGIVASILLVVAPATRAAEPDAFAAPKDLKRTLTIQWRLGPDYPMGIQESALGLVGGKLVSAGGFTRHPLKVVQQYPDAFGGEASGFTALTLALDSAHEDAGWQRIADVPGPARQGAMVAVVEDALYVIGGFNYTAPHTYCDTYRLQQLDGRWTWTCLETCPTPWPVYGAAATCAVIGHRIYLHGAADNFQPEGAEGPDFHSEAGREGSPVGSALLVLDTDDLAAGWKRLADRPGLPQFNIGFAAAGGKLWHLGGTYAPLRKLPGGQPGEMPYYNAVDSWSYDPATDHWTRLRDMPDGSNRHALTYRDRYVVLIAGYKYPVTWHLDGTRTEAYSAEEKGKDWTTFFETTVLVYDTVTGELGRADDLLEQTSDPSLAMVGTTVYCLGGEGGPRLWHPATLQIGTISEP